MYLSFKGKTAIHLRYPLTSQSAIISQLDYVKTDGARIMITFNKPFTDRGIVLDLGAVGRFRSASYGGTLISHVAVCSDRATQLELSDRPDRKRVVIPTEKAARVKFLSDWAKDQKRRAATGSAVSLLVIPMFASSALAEGGTLLSDLSGVESATVQSDGSLRLELDDGTSASVDPDDYTITADGQYVLSAEALAGLEAVGVAPAAPGGLLAGLGAAVAGGAAAAGGGGGDDAGGSSSTTGFVVDGYISGATVFRDSNNNGLLDEGEVSTTTNAEGAFSLGGNSDEPIVSIGGVDISTGLNFEGTLKAPAGSTVISPVTTLVQQIIEADDTDTITVDDAIAQVNSALGLDEDTDLLNEDPIASGNDDLFAAGAKVVNIVNVGVAAGAEEDEIIAQLADEISAAAADPDNAPDNILSDADTVQAVLEDAFEGVTDAPSETEIGAVAITATNANAAVDVAVENAKSNDEDVVQAVAPVQQVVQNDVAKGIEEKVENDEEITEVTQDTIEEEADNAQEVVDGAVSFGTGFAEDFSEDVTLGASTESEHGVWYVDRYAPANFETVSDFGSEIGDATFDGGSVLKLTTEFVENQTAFDQTQGRKFDIPEGSTEVSIQLYIDPAWEPAEDATSGFRQAGFWATALDSEGNLHYPIIEFSTLNGDDTFRVYTGVGSSGAAEWINLGLPEGFEYGSFQDLKMSVNDDGSVTFEVGNLTQTVGMDNGGFSVSSLDNVILQGHNGYSVDPNNPSSDRPAHDIYWDGFSANGSFVEVDTDLSDFDQVNFAEIPYDVAPGVELTLSVEQAGSLQIGGSGTVKLVGEFDATADLTGITVPIDATEVTGIDTILTADEANGLQIDLPADAVLNIDVDYADLSLDNPSLTPEIDLSGITVNGSSSPAGLFEVLNAGSVEDTFKLLWNQADNNYYDAFPGGTPDVNAANVELGNLYAQYLLDGNAPLLGIVQTKVSGNPDFAVRQQSLHDNLLGNIKDSVVTSRINSDTLDADNRDSAGLQFGDRPIYNGRLANEDDLLATQVWDIANGIPRSDFTVGSDQIYVLNGDTVVDANDETPEIDPFDSLSDAAAAADEGAYIVVGPDTFLGTVNITTSMTIVGVGDAAVDGNFVITGDGDSSVVVDVKGLDVDTGAWAFYLEGGESEVVTLNLSNVDITGDGTSAARGVIMESGVAAEINVSGGSFTDLQSGIYLNRDTALNVDGTEFTNNTAAIGTDDPASLTVINSTFDGNGEAIGISGDHENSNVTLSGNAYLQETDEVLVYFAREGNSALPTATLPGEWSNVTIAQSSDADNNKALLSTITGTDGDDVIVDHILENVIDVSAGGSDFILLSIDEPTEGLNQIQGFTAGSADVDGQDVIAFRADAGLDTALRGSGFEVLFDDDALGAETGFAALADVSLASTSNDVIENGLVTADISAILDAVDPLVDGEDGIIQVAVSDSNGDDTLVVSVDLDETAEDADRVLGLAILEDTSVGILTDDNLYDFSAVQANT